MCVKPYEMRTSRASVVPKMLRWCVVSVCTPLYTIVRGLVTTQTELRLGVSRVDSAVNSGTVISAVGGRRSAPSADGDARWPELCAPLRPQRTTASWSCAPPSTCGVWVLRRSIDASVLYTEEVVL
jgi:hypothetical protein